MFLAIPLGYFTAVFLLVTGVFSCVDFINTLPEETTGSETLNGLSQAGWPILAAVVILLLIQICRQLESLRLVASYSPAPGNETGKKAKKKKARADEKAESPAGSAVGQPGLAHLATAAPEPLRYPNSPIPGGGRVPQPAVAPQPATVPQTRVMKQAPRLSSTTPQPDTQGLSYFKVE